MEAAWPYSGFGWFLLIIPLGCLEVPVVRIPISQMGKLRPQPHIALKTSSG